MASDNMNYPESGSIAQAMKHQIRSGSFWDSRTPAEKESIDQIATAIARMVVGDGAHWDSIINYAQAATLIEPPGLKKDRSFDYPYTTPVVAQRANRVGLEAIERSIREIPTRDGNA
jgi:hypothetical protein